MSHNLTTRLQLSPEQEAISAKCFHPSGAFVEFRKEEVEQSIPRQFEKILATTLNTSQSRPGTAGSPTRS